MSEELIPRSIVLKLVKQMLGFPFPQICRHDVALRILDSSEFNSAEYNNLIKAICRADDYTALHIISEIEKESE